MLRRSRRAAADNLLRRRLCRRRRRSIDQHNFLTITSCKPLLLVNLQIQILFSAEACTGTADKADVCYCRSMYFIFLFIFFSAKAVRLTTLPDVIPYIELNFDLSFHYCIS